MSHFPHRWKDLIQYQLLILRTYSHYSGRVWLGYHAFREHAATSKLTDWSAMNVQLFNSPAAGAAVRVSSAQSSTVLNHLAPPFPLWRDASCEIGGGARPLIPCIAHHCSLCSGSHRVLACLQGPSKTGKDDGRRCASPEHPCSSASSKSCHV